jgi:type IV pilus assembly protein PilA
MKLDKKMQGFSLIELLVVVAIIGILAAVGTVGYSNYMNSTKQRVTTANAEATADGLKTLAAAANTGAGCTSWEFKSGGAFGDGSGCLDQIITSIKKNPYLSTDTQPIIYAKGTSLPAALATATTNTALTGTNVCIASAGSTGASYGPLSASDTGLNLGRIIIFKNTATFDVTVGYCTQNQTTAGNYDYNVLPTFNFGQ